MASALMIRSQSPHFVFLAYWFLYLFQDFIRDMTVAAIFRVPLQMVLMLLCTPDVIRQRQHFHNDFIPVLPAVNKGSCFFPDVRDLCCKGPVRYFFPTSTPCLSRLYGSMISNRCSISSVTLVHFSSKTTLTHSAYPSYGPSSVFVVPLALPASVVRTPGTVSKNCWTPQRHPPAMYTVSIL